MLKLHIKNMVCPRCIDTVQHIFEQLKINIETIKLGEVIILAEFGEAKKELLEAKLLQHGFELIKDQKSKLIDQIKSIIIDQIHYKTKNLKSNYSVLLAEKLHHEYTFLSKLFSSVEGITIERFILKHKIEKVKELLFYNQLTLSEITFQMDYSSTAHLSSQFKKETGMTPTEFKKLRKPAHKSLDSLL